MDGMFRLGGTAGGEMYELFCCWVNIGSNIYDRHASFWFAIAVWVFWTLLDIA